MTKPPLSPPDTVVVDGFGADAVACARLLLSEGHRVHMVGERASDDARALSALGVTITEEPSSILEEPGAVLVVDCWTGETAPLVQCHRAVGAHVTGIGDLLLERTRARTLGVTGSAGKTTATRAAAAMMSAGGCSVVASTTARAGNAWPAAEMIADARGPGPDAWLALELTSTHLAYMHRSPDIAVITAWWPDHVEMHGSVARYREAKSTILRHQTPEGVCIVNADDAGALGFADVARGDVLEASANRPVPNGVGVERGLVTVRMDTGTTRLCRRDQIPLAEPIVSVALTAACAALAAGAAPSGVANRLLDPAPLPFRGREHGQINGVAMVDASAATTPRKALGALAGRDRGRVILLVGGDTEVNGVPVHASAEERAALASVMAELTACSATVAFGRAGARVDATCRVATLSDAVAVALERARPGDTVLLAPMFPLSMEQREAFAILASRGSTTVPP